MPSSRSQYAFYMVGLLFSSLVNIFEPLAYSRNNLIDLSYAGITILLLLQTFQVSVLFID